MGWGGTSTRRSSSPTWVASAGWPQAVTTPCCSGSSRFRSRPGRCSVPAPRLSHPGPGPRLWRSRGYGKTREHVMSRHQDADGQGRRVVVVGAGLAGLTAAATAARGGAAVTLLEARRNAGGRARTRRVDGFLLNQGAHALYRGGPGWEVLTALGVTPSGRGPETARAWALRGDGRYDVIPAGAGTMARSSLVDLASKVELAWALARSRSLGRTVVPGTSMREWIEHTVQRSDAPAVLAMASRVATYCGDLDGLDAVAGVLQLQRALSSGVVYLDGGWQQLVDALRDIVCTSGVTIDVGVKVDAVEHRADGALVRTGAGDIAADVVVLANGGPSDADALLRGASDVVRRWVERERPVVVSALDVALRSLPEPRRRITIGFDDPLYLSVHTPYARLATKGGELVHLLWYGESAEDPRARLEALFDRAQPGWRGEVVAERYARRLVVAHGRPAPGAGAAGRPTCTVPDLPGVFVAGHWVGPEGMLADAALASGRAAGRAAAHRVTGRVAVSSPVRAT